jgi:putative ABC transport system permease protein
MRRAPRTGDEAPPRAPAWRRYLHFWGTRVDDDVDAELAFHVDMRVQDYLARGMSEADARAAARSRLGDLHGARDACVNIGQRRQRRMTRARIIDTLVQDARYGARTLRRQLGWTVVAVLTLALGIGSTTAMFGVVNSLILHPLPYRDADRVFMVWRVDPVHSVMMSGSPDGGRAYELSATTLEGIEPYGGNDMTLSGRGDASTVRVGVVRSSFLSFAGLKTIVGRGFSRNETQSSGARVAMISEQLWRSRYGSAFDILGQSIVLNDKAYTIIGVTEAAMRLPDPGGAQPLAWLPVNTDSMSYSRSLVARLRRGASKASAERELGQILNRITPPGAKPFEVRLAAPAEMVAFRDSLFLLSGAVAMLMLVACANVAHLLLARGATRQRELAIRAALGAGRGRLARQLLTESLLLAAVGCSVGVGFGFVIVRALIAARPASLNQLAQTQLGGRALAVAVAVSIATALMFGCTAAFHALRRTNADSLRTTSQSDGATRGTHRLRSLLVVTEMALSAMLLVGATLVVRSVARLQRVDPGFASSGLYALPIALPLSQYPTVPEREAFARAALDRVRMLGDVDAATIAGGAPPNAAGYMMGDLEGDGIAPNSSAGFLAFNNVADNYFALLRTPVIAGTVFRPGSATRHEVIVSQGMAKKLWPGTSAVGHRIRVASRGTTANDWSTVIGVVGDMALRSLSGDRSEPQLYFPLGQADWPSEITIIARVRGASDLVAALRPIVPGMDHRLAPPAVRTIDGMLADTISKQRFTMTLLAAFAGLAVVLSAIGLFGVMSYVVTQRTREIGIRVALGATPRRVAQTIVSRGLLLSVFGLLLGLGASMWGTKLIRGSLYGITATDPASYLMAGMLLLGVCGLACAIPTRRAVAIDPTIAMRGD